MMRLLTYAALALIPLTSFFVAQRLFGGRMYASILTSALVSSILGAVMAGVATGMAPWVAPENALLRGAAFGFLGGLPVGAAGALVTIIWRRRVDGD